jgi:arylsulfatase A-like enzyme
MHAFCFPILLRKTVVAIVLISAAAMGPREAFTADPNAPAKRPPNVVLITTDDQGYGDLSCHGNTELRTPALDQLHGESIRLTNFHVDPTCSPTRAALMTGRYSSRTGVWHTIGGRSLLRKDEVTLANVLGRAGYRTAIFGKWHLGDNYPFRPQERGFDESLIHGGGGVGQTPDVWGNDYFDDSYLHNGRKESQTGYCTDVFFRAATKFIESHRDRPFFAYIAPNAPHGPYNVSDSDAQPYRAAGIPSPRAEFYGMIANIDANVGRLLRRLDELKLSENTIVLWMTDNGSAAGKDRSAARKDRPGVGYDGGMRGMKGDEYEGGHRVPCFLRYPAGWQGGRDVSHLTAHIDLLPTLVELCGATAPEGVALDGKSLVQLLKQSALTAWPERTLVVHSQRVETPEKWRKCAVMTDRWRLVNGKELYDIRQDPYQQRDLAADHRDVVAELLREYNTLWTDISTRFGEFCPIELGAEQAISCTLSCHDWHGDDGPWNQALVAKDLRANGFWAVDFVRSGTYRVTLRARPAGVPHLLKAVTAKLRIGDSERSLPVAVDSESIAFELPIAAGQTRLQTWFEEASGAARGAYYVEIERRGE